MFFKTCFLLTFLFAASYCKSVDRDYPENNALHVMCLRNADEEAYKALRDAEREVIPCTYEDPEFKKLIADVTTANTSGNFDAVTKLHCALALQYKSCEYKMYESRGKCMTRADKDKMEILLNMGTKTADMACGNDGKWSSVFVAKGGVECVSTNWKKIQNCVFDNIVKNLEKKHEHMLSFDKAGCDQISALQKCTVDAIKTCTDPKLAEMTNDLFEAALEVTPCEPNKE